MKVGPHDPKALVRAADSLAFLVRDTAHITPANFEICVDAIRAFVEASINGVNKLPSAAEQRKKPKRNRRSKSSATDEQPEMESNTEEYHKVSMQLLELMQTLHTRAGRIFRSWGEEHPEQSIDIGALWDAGWCPLLQVIYFREVSGYILRRLGYRSPVLRYSAGRPNACIQLFVQFALSPRSPSFDGHAVGSVFPQSAFPTSHETTRNGSAFS